MHLRRRAALASLARPLPNAPRHGHREDGARPPVVKGVYSLVYASDSRMEPEVAVHETDGIVAGAISRNGAMALTGSLIFTGTSFAQILEGDRFAVESLMASIRSDPRHTGIVNLHSGYGSERMFGDWCMAYAGCSPMVEALIERARATARLGSGRGVTDLFGFMKRFAGRSRPHAPTG